MDGDEAPLAEIVELAERFDAHVMVDEAHATGVFGPNGAGIVAKLGLGDRILVQMGTLGKALGGFGAYVAGSRALRELMINRCRTFIFTTSLPPSVLATSIAAIDILEKEPQRRLALWHNCRALRDGLKKIGFTLGEGQGPIQPVMIGDAGKCMAFSARLLEKGVFCQGIRPPTVPAGTSRLRATVMATHNHEHLHRALRVFEEVKRESNED
jgi:7-keto-8-aminopelargonate synthetase-like enzyme